MSGTEERLSFAFQIRGRPEAAVSVDETNVPRGIRQFEASGPTTVGKLMQHFDDTHTSVVGQPATLSSPVRSGGGGSSLDLEQQAKRARVPPSTGTDYAITISARDQSGETTWFRISLRNRLQKLFSAYAEKKGVGVQSLRFLFDGQMLTSDDSPFNLNMEDGDQIDVMNRMQGD